MRPTSAGLAKFMPMPPNNCLTSTMATNAPTTAVHKGIVGGRLNARMMPVTTAEQSDTVCGRFIRMLNSASNSTQAATVTATTASARAPKMMAEAIIAGTSAMMTWIISPRVDEPSTMCGEALTRSFFSSIYFLPAFLCISFARPIVCDTGRLAGHT